MDPHFITRTMHTYLDYPVAAAVEWRVADKRIPVENRGDNRGYRGVTLAESTARIASTGGQSGTKATNGKRARDCSPDPPNLAKTTVRLSGLCGNEAYEICRLG